MKLFKSKKTTEDKKTSFYGLKLSQKEELALKIAASFAVVIAVYFLRFYFGLIVVSAIAAFLFFPVYAKLNKRMRPGSAAAWTLLISMFAVIIPVILIALATALQLRSVTGDIAQWMDSSNVNANVNELIVNVNNFLGQLTNNRVQVSVSNVTDWLSQNAGSIGQSILNFILGSFGSITSVITGVILFMYIFLALLMHQERLIKYLKDLNPLGKEISQVYINRTAGMTKAMVRGQFLIAICQGTVGALTLYLAGIDLFWFFLMLLTMLSIIPLGGGIVTIPIGIAMLFTGNISGGLIVLLGHFLVVTNIDNVLRPKLVPANVRLNSALTMLAVFAGIRMFGFIGIVIGPVLMILVTTTLQMYLDVKDSRASS